MADPAPSAGGHTWALPATVLAAPAGVAAEDPDPAPPERAPGLRRALGWFAAIALGVAAYLAALGLAGAPDMLPAAAVPLALTACLGWARRLVDRGRLAAAVHAVVGAVLLGAAAYAWLVPGSLLALALVPVLGIALGLPYLRGAALARLAAAAWLAGVGAMALSLFRPPAPDLPSAEFRFAAYAAVVAVAAGLLLHFSARLHASLAEARAVHRELRAVDRRKARFLSATAHELRTPMTPVMAQLHLLHAEALGPLNERQRRAAQVMDRNLQRLNGLVEDVLDVARVQAGALRVVRQPVDLRTALAEAAASFAPAADRAGVALEVDAPEGLLAHADPRRLAQVLDNLLGNALKFTPAGGRVLLAAGPGAPGRAVLRVADTGRGIAPQDQDLLFQPFSRLPGSDAAPGAGLGLYVCRGIAEAHGGRIWCESDGLGTGACFALELPLAPGVPGVPGAPAAPGLTAPAPGPRPGAAGKPPARGSR